MYVRRHKFYFEIVKVFQCCPLNASFITRNLPIERLSTGEGFTAIWPARKALLLAASTTTPPKIHPPLFQFWITGSVFRHGPRALRKELGKVGKEAGFDNDSASLIRAPVTRYRLLWLVFFFFFFFFFLFLLIWCCPKRGLWPACRMEVSPCM